MARPFKITWVYQADEEVLQSSIWYLNTFSNDLDPSDLTNVSSSVITRLVASLDSLAALNIMSHAVTVTTPAIDSVGPSRFINAHGVTMNGEGEVISWDRAVANVKLTGENDAEEPVVGGMRLSIIPKTYLNRNQLDSGWVDDLTTALNIIFPQVITDANDDWQRCIKSVRNGADPEYVYPAVLTVSSKVGVNLTRVGNRPQRNTGQTVPA